MLIDLSVGEPLVPLESLYFSYKTLSFVYKVTEWL